jgi:hypothetical protein
MEHPKAEENRAAYYEFLVRLDEMMCEALGTAVKPFEANEPQEMPADGKSGE